jgi:hypothetical protein
MRLPILATLAKSGVSGFFVKSIVDLKVTRIGIPKSRESEYALVYSKNKDALIGIVAFTCTPVPEASMEPDGTLTEKSPYYGNIIVAVLRWLNTYVSDYEDKHGNSFVKLHWEKKDIESVKMESDTYGEVRLRKEDASVYASNITDITASAKDITTRIKSAIRSI